MLHIVYIAQKDLTQILRDRKSFLFSLIMPVVFTLLLSYAFGGFDSAADARLPVGWLDQDGSRLSRKLFELLADSRVIRLVGTVTESPDGLERRVGESDLAGAVIVPVDFGHHLSEGKPIKLLLITDVALPAGTTVESEILAAMIHLDGALRTAAILERRAAAPFDYTYTQALAAWRDPPVRVDEQTGAPAAIDEGANEALAHNSPGMMIQFAIAGLLVSAQIFVEERKTRCLQRMLTTSARRVHILAGHWLAVFCQIMVQFVLLIAFGQFVLHVAYLRAPLASLMMAASTAACIAGLGLLIGVLARTDDQAVIFSLVPMFLLAGLGGAWVPLEVAGPVMRTIGHLSPVAWAMDGFENIVIRGLGIEAALLPAAVLAAYGVVFFVLAAWRFASLEEK